MTKRESANPARSTTRRLAKTSLIIDDEVYIRALSYKASLRRHGKHPMNRRMGEIVSEALDQYLKKEGF